MRFFPFAALGMLDKPSSNGWTAPTGRSFSAGIGSVAHRTGHPWVEYRLFSLVASAILFLAAPVSGFEPGSDEFFETKIRPVLVKHCYECHSADAGEAGEIGGSLWLDSADGMRSGGDSGPAIEPGNAKGSVLIAALRYETSEMPPDQPLPEEVVNDFVRWIDAGAVDPRVQDPAAGHRRPTGIDLAQGREFWAFRPITDFRDELDPDDRARIGDRVVDELVDDRLRSERLTPVAAAPPEVRLRRLAQDLTGLPPSESMRRRWMESSTPEVWSDLVDQLLESRGFAQHWARHWMDVARYADSNGSDFNATFHDAWRYRDYLVDSFDRDRPFDQLIRQQIAGDLLPAETDQDRYDNVVATTFLMLGPKMLSERAKKKLQLDVVDEQIDTIGRAFLGMTLGCARCHDHKFDPIPTADYYALAGIFKSTQTLNGESQKYVSTWNRTELPTSAEHRQAITDHATKLKTLEASITGARQRLQAAQSKTQLGHVVDDSEATKHGTWKASTYSKGYIGAGYVHDDNGQKGKLSIEFRKRLPAAGQYRVRFAYNTSGNRAARVPLTIETATGVRSLTVNQRSSLDAAPWKDLGVFEFSQEQDAVVVIRNDDTDGYVIVDAVAFVPVDGGSDEEEEVEAAEEIASIQSELTELENALKRHREDAPGPIPVAMAPRDFPQDQISDSPIHIRGEATNVGDVVSRGFLRVCGPGDAVIDTPQGSGRIELADWLTDPDNPLVARVIVNRVWMHLFGNGLVRTVDNFGTRGERPTHPQLMDALAIDLMRNGWHLKPLIRRIVLSDAYSRSSDPDADAIAVDPENRLLWRMNRKRLPAEAIRDAMLTAAGTLSDAEPTAPVADKGVLVTKNSGATKAVASGIDSPVRSIYLPVIRGYIAPLMQAIDVADPDLLVGKRPTTNVPGQALVLLNSEHVNGWAEQTAERVNATGGSWDSKIERVFRLCLSREPTQIDRDAVDHYVGEFDRDDPALSRERLKDLVAAIFASAEFRMLD